MAVPESKRRKKGNPTKREIFEELTDVVAEQEVRLQQLEQRTNFLARQYGVLDGVLTAVMLSEFDISPQKLGDIYNEWLADQFEANEQSEADEDEEEASVTEDEPNEEEE